MAIRMTGQLPRLGQSLWLDNITRELLESDTLKRYVEDLSVTGLTSNPAIFNSAISDSSLYDNDIRSQLNSKKVGEELFFDLAIHDLRRAADLFFPVYQQTSSVDGFVSLEVSPLLAHDTHATIEQALKLYAKAGKPNLFIKIPGTPEGLLAIEESIFSGVPINVTLLFSADQYKAAADAYMNGLERRLKAGLSVDVRSVASIFVSRWDVAVADKVPTELRNALGIAISRQTYKAYRDILDSDRFKCLENAGARAQRLLFASTGTKDKAASDTLYVSGLIAANTINTMPESTLLAFADHGVIESVLSRDGGDADSVLAKHVDAGIDLTALSIELQSNGADSFVKSWKELLAAIESKRRDTT